jgi:DNA-binding Lrp family transcriptional regulator
LIPRLLPNSAPQTRDDALRSSGTSEADRTMDEIDRQLLEILQQDATLSIAQMAERVGLSATPCWKRIQKLEDQGVITHRVAVVDPDRIGVGLSVLVSVEAGEHTPEWLARFSAGVAPLYAKPRRSKLQRRRRASSRLSLFGCGRLAWAGARTPTT